MSASLVGSEMCIRDSANTTAFTTQASRGTRVSLQLRPEDAPRAGQGLACLLYTSDAADDM
eukprot:875891-Alexandrium_andersonii.AAC.1